MSNNGNPIPVYVLGLKNGQGTKFPTDSLCYVVAGNGLFRSIRSSFFEVCVKVDGAKHLENVEEGYRVLLPKLPVALFREAEAFCVAVRKRDSAEAVVLLAANPTLGAWKLLCPEQTVSGASAKYDLKSLPTLEDGWALFGTIHSHPGGAFHSGTDDKDEFGFDGLHITIGNLEELEHQYAVRWILGGKECTTSMSAVLDLPPAPEATFDQAWLSRVSKPAYASFSQDNEFGYPDYFEHHRTPAPDEAQRPAPDEPDSIFRDWPGVASELRLFTEEDIQGLDDDLIEILATVEEQYTQETLTFGDLAEKFDEVRKTQDTRNEDAMRDRKRKETVKK